MVHHIQLLSPQRKKNYDGIPLIPSESVIQFEKLQFLIRSTYAMTTNKSQE